ncbi:hypothetical protein ACFX2I_001807 [Malus domestica]
MNLLFVICNCMFRRNLDDLQSSRVGLTTMLILLPIFLFSFVVAPASAADLNQDFDITWGDGRAKILNNVELLTHSLDKASSSGFQSNHEHLFGKIDMQLKLAPGNSAGTVTAYYLARTMCSFSLGTAGV